MYRTGDLAMVDAAGDLIYMGRKDFQIKHMGNRIELGEIETAVSQRRESLPAAACMTRRKAGLCFSIPGAGKSRS